MQCCSSIAVLPGCLLWLTIECRPLSDTLRPTFDVTMTLHIMGTQMGKGARPMGFLRERLELIMPGQPCLAAADSRRLTCHGTCSMLRATCVKPRAPAAGQL